MTASIYKLTRRAAGGAAGAPSSLLSGQIAYNEQDGLFYVGFGDNGSGVATSIKVFAKDDFNVNKLFQTGGSTGQVPTKNSITDYDWSWATPSGSTYSAGASGGLILTGTVFTVDYTLVAALASPALSGNPTTPNQTAGNNSTRIANTAYVDTGLALKANLASPTFTGTPLSTTPSASDNSTKIATTAYVDAADALKANLASPTFTGTVTIPNQTANDNSTKAANTAYVDNAVSALSQGLNPKGLVKAASTANLTLSGAQTVDGISLVAGDRILVKDQTTTANNGIYLVASGAWTRAVDMDAWAEVPGAYVFTSQGSTQAELGFVCTSDAGGTLNTTAITFVQFTGAGQITAGNGITKTANTLSVNYTGLLTSKT